jgi:hypothetical protein
MDKKKFVQRTLVDLPRYNPTGEEQNEIDFLMTNLFKPSKDDTPYFYYTEVFSDWVDRK